MFIDVKIDIDIGQSTVATALSLIIPAMPMEFYRL